MVFRCFSEFHKELRIELDASRIRAQLRFKLEIDEAAQSSWYHHHRIQSPLIHKENNGSTTIFTGEQIDKILISVIANAVM